MKKAPLLLLGAALFLSMSHAAHAQNICVDSPENPTAILAVVGAAGAFFASARARVRANRTPSKK